MKKLVPVMFFASAVKDARFISCSNMFPQIKLLIALNIQIQVFILVSAGYVDFNSNHSQMAETRRIKRAQRARPTCTQPPVTPDKNYFVKLSFKDEPTDAKPGQTVPENATISSQCNRGYALDYENEESHETISICKSNSWQPSLPKCKRICMSLSNLLNFNMTCYQYFGGPKAPCTGLLLEGAIVKPRCLQKFHPDKNVDYDYATCRDGNWDKEFVNCTPECGAVASSAIPLIADGYLEKRGGAPWNLVIYSIQWNPKIPQFICGGTLITAELAISAAHCFYNETSQEKLDNGFFYAVVGKATPDFNVTDYPTTKTYRLRNIFFPDGRTFEGAITNYAGDIVILQLSEKVTFSTDVFPACLHWDQKDPFYPDKNVTGKLSGFGSKRDGTFPKSLLTANLPFISYTECKKNVEDDFRSAILTDKFCAGSKTGSGARRGDSGGGLLFMDEATGLYHLRGVVSIKDFSDSSIATFTDVAQYMYWILKIKNEIENESEPCKCNTDGSLSTNSSCDSGTMNCKCKAFVTGTNCDECRDGYWKLHADHPDGCVACECNPTGSHSSTCDKIKGSCQCKPNIIGRQCDECADNRKVLRANGCEDVCKCNPKGSLSDSCDSKTGNCQCKEFVTGKNCDTCKDGYWALEVYFRKGCIDCECSSDGSQSSTCDKITGSCQCKPGLIGIRCDECADEEKVVVFNGCEDPVKWVKYSPGNICLNASGLHNATDRSDTLLIARHQSTHKLASIPRSGGATQFSEYEMLCGQSLKWVKAESKAAPPRKAILGFREDSNDPYSDAYYMCKATISGGVSNYGEVQPDGVCYIEDSFNWKVFPPANYWIMASTHATGGPKWVKFSNGEKCSNPVVADTTCFCRQCVPLRYQFPQTSQSGKFNYTNAIFFGCVNEFPGPHYELLCGDEDGWEWLHTENVHSVPRGAVSHRMERTAKYQGIKQHPGLPIIYTYYICRAIADDGSMVVGEILDHAEYCIISHGGREIRKLPSEFDFLIQSV